MNDKERCSVCGKIPQGITMRKSELLIFLSDSPLPVKGSDVLYCSLTCLKESMGSIWSKNVDTWCSRRHPVAVPPELHTPKIPPTLRAIK